MTDIFDDIPVATNMEVGDTKPTPFPVDIEPMDSEWWLIPSQKEVCDRYLGECKLDQMCAYTRGRTFKTKSSAAATTTMFFKKPKIRRYLYLKMKKLADKVDLSQEMILRDLIDVKEMALGRKAQNLVLGVDKDGFPIVEFAKSTDLKAANTALTQLGRYHKLSMWTEKVDQEISVVNFNFNMGAPEENKAIELVKGLTLENDSDN